MQGKVDRVEQSKSKKSWRVKIGSSYYGAGLDSQINGAAGKTIDFTAEDGDFGPWIKSWAYAQGAPASGTQREPSNSPAGASGGRFYLPFTSNICAHAIAAGLIKQPADLNAWAKAARDVAVALDTL